MNEIDLNLKKVNKDRVKEIEESENLKRTKGSEKQKNKEKSNEEV